MGSTSSPDQGTPSERTLHLQQAFKLAFSLVLFYAFSLSVNWDVSNYGALAIVLVSLDVRGASLQKGIARIIGTTVGVIIGFWFLSAFSHNRWTMLAALNVYAVIITYGMQGSRTPYAWFVAGFVPFVIWGDNYPNFQDAFYFGTFRWLQTTTGVLIYTIVDCMFWPRRAGRVLAGLQAGAWHQAGDMLRMTSRRVGPRSEYVAIRASASGDLSKAAASLQLALYDSPDVRRRRSTWRSLQLASAESLNAVQLIDESISSCRELGLDDRAKRTAPIIDSLAKRLDWLGDSVIRLENGSPIGTAPTETMVSLTKEDGFDSLSPPQRASVRCLQDQLDRLSQATSAAVRALGDGNSAIPGVALGEGTFVDWSPSPTFGQRLTRAMYPALTFTLCFLFWIVVVPPTGAKTPMFAAILGLMVVMARINPVSLVTLLVSSVFLVVAPVYWLIMPRLEGGESLLLFVFIFSMLFGYLGAIRPAVKSGVMINFVNMAGISNQQSYSFQGPVDGGLMTCLAGIAVVLVYFVYLPMRGERMVTQWLDRFAKGCVGVGRTLADLPFGVDGDKGNRRIRLLRNSILPAATQIRDHCKSAGAGSTAAPTNEQIEHVCDCIQATANRLLAFEMSLQRTGPLDTRDQRLLESIGDSLLKRLRRLTDWRRLGADSGAAGIMGDENLGKKWRHELEQQLQQVASEAAPLGQSVKDTNSRSKDDEHAARIYTVIGNASSLLESIAATEQAMGATDWAYYTETRF